MLEREEKQKVTSNYKYDFLGNINKKTNSLVASVPTESTKRENVYK